jgi:ubiquinone biosynthesis protein UbiJ
MNNPPFPFSPISDALNQLRERFSEKLKPPAWLTQEAQNRLVLLLNHVLMQEPQAQARLTGQAGREIGRASCRERVSVRV